MIFSTSFISKLSTCALFICYGAGIVWASSWTVPNISGARHRHIGPIVQFTAKRASCGHAWSLVCRSTSAQMRPHAIRSDAIYLTSVAVARGGSIGLHPHAPIMLQRTSSFLWTYTLIQCLQQNNQVRQGTPGSSFVEAFSTFFLLSGCGEKKQYKNLLFFLPYLWHHIL